MIKEYNIEEIYRRQIGHGSLGMTNKFFKDNYWYKQNNKGYEGKSEYLVTKILDNSDIGNYASYEECIINGVPGCRSKNFLNEGESLITLSRLYNLTYGGDLKNKINSYVLLSDRIEYVMDFVNEFTGLDIHNYLGKVLKIDMLTYDVDRHFNNLAIIKTNGGYKEAPLFDYGASYFSMQHVFTDNMSLAEKIKKMTPQPFSVSFEEQAMYFQDVEISLDYDGITRAIKNESSELQEIILFNLDRYKFMFNDKKIVHELDAIDIER